jgi:hypothetical protein
MMLTLGHFRKVDHNCFESFEMWCWTGMKKISLTDCVKNEEVLCTVKEKWSILHTIKQRKANWIGHFLSKNSVLKHVTEGKIKGTGRWKRCKNLPYDVTEKRRYWKVKQEALDHTGSRTCFGRCYRPVIRQTTVSLLLSAHENNS